MLPDDQFRLQLKQTTETLEAWAREMSDVAAIECDMKDGIWRLAALPAARNACRFELGIRNDQNYDISIATHLFEDQPLQDFDLLPTLVRAISDGQVVTRRMLSPKTGAEIAIQVEAFLNSHKSWLREILHSATVAPGHHELTAAEQHYLPYRPPPGAPRSDAPA